MKQLSLQDRLLLLILVAQKGLGESKEQQERLMASVLNVPVEEIRSALAELQHRDLVGYST